MSGLERKDSISRGSTIDKQVRLDMSLDGRTNGRTHID